MNECKTPAVAPFRTDGKGNVFLYERKTVLPSHASMKAQALLTRAGRAGKTNADVDVAEALHLPGPPIVVDWFTAVELAVSLFGIAANGTCEAIGPEAVPDLLVLDLAKIGA